MSSEHLASAKNHLKGDLGGSWNILDGASGQYTDLGIARRFGGAVAAYSLRDIGAMNGPVVNVRRSGDDANQDFSANQVSSGALAAWVDAGGGDKDGFVEIWYDQSGNGNDISQTSADADQPQIVDNGVVITDGGNPAIKFNASEFLDVSSGEVDSAAQFLVVNVTDTASGSRTIIGRKSDTEAFFRITGGDDENYKCNGTSNTFGLDIQEGSTVIFSIDRDGSNNTKLFEDNAQSGVTKTNVTGDFSFQRLGARNAALDPFIGTMSEILMFSGDYSADRETITLELNAYYGAF